MILVPMNTPGVTVERHLPGVRLRRRAARPRRGACSRTCACRPRNMLLGEGRGFEIAQGRLGPGRIHHCMRVIGVAERALETMCQRLLTRTAFGKKLYEHSVWEERIADARIEIECARLLTLKAAYMMDTVGNKVARAEIAMIKVKAPNMALEGHRRRDPGARRRRRDRGLRPRARRGRACARCGSPTAPTRCTAARSRRSSSSGRPRRPASRASRAAVPGPELADSASNRSGERAPMANAGDSRRSGWWILLSSSALCAAFAPGAGAGVLDGLLGGGGSACTPQTCGRFAPPFVEPTLAGTATAEKCLPDADGELVCKPAAGTMALLDDGRDPLLGRARGHRARPVQRRHRVRRPGGERSEPAPRRSAPATRRRGAQPTPPDGGANPGGTQQHAAPARPATPTMRRAPARSSAPTWCSSPTAASSPRAARTTTWSPASSRFPFGVIELEGLKNTRIFNPADDHWAQTDSMHYGRWYPTLVTLARRRRLRRERRHQAGQAGLSRAARSTRGATSCRPRPSTSAAGAGRRTARSPSARCRPIRACTCSRTVTSSTTPPARRSIRSARLRHGALERRRQLRSWRRASWTDLAYAGLPLELNQVGLEQLVSALNPTNPLAASAPHRRRSRRSSARVVEDPVALLEQLGGAARLRVDPDAVAAALGSGFRGSTFSVMLPLEPDASGAYTKAEFLTAGGVLGAVVVPSPGTLPRHQPEPHRHGDDRAGRASATRRGSPASSTSRAGTRPACCCPTDR